MTLYFENVNLLSFWFVKISPTNVLMTVRNSVVSSPSYVTLTAVITLTAVTLELSFWQMSKSCLFWQLGYNCDVWASTDEFEERDWRFFGPLDPFIVFHQQKTDNSPPFSPLLRHAVTERAFSWKNKKNINFMHISDFLMF